jgi:hypothetical protein
MRPFSYMSWETGRSSTGGRTRPADLGKQAPASVIPDDIRLQIEARFIEPAQVADDVVDAVTHDTTG